MSNIYNTEFAIATPTISPFNKSELCYLEVSIAASVLSSAKEGDADSVRKYGELAQKVSALLKQVTK